MPTSDGSGAGCFFSTHLGWYIGIYNDGIAVLYDTESGNEVDSPVGVTDTAWHHIAVTKNGTNVVFYIDGNGYTSAPYNDTFVFSGEAAIGGYSSDGAYYESFYGSIDELSIYNRALSASEIQAIYNAGSAGKCATFESAPSIVLQPTNQTVILGDQVSFSVTATSFGPEGYQWSFR